MKKYLYQIRELNLLKRHAGNVRGDLNQRLGEINSLNSKLFWVSQMSDTMASILNGNRYTNMVAAIEWAANILSTIEEED